MNYKILKIDKTNWRPVKFGDVVVEPKEICKDIFAEGVEHVVGLEHIDSGDLHLRKSETIEESTTFSKKFRKGDVLFGRRRAYLKKAAQASFDGICSGDITVFRAKKELSPELLPFIVNHDKFFDYAVKHSAGGLSPRVKFKDLANYEFLLPPKAEQARLSELLCAMDDVIEKEKVVLKRLESTKLSTVDNYLKSATISKSINEFGKVVTGNTPPTDNLIYWGGNVPFVTPGDIKESPFVLKTERFLTKEGIKKSRLIPVNSVMVVCIGSTIGKVAINRESCCTNQQINSIIPYEGESSIYLYNTLKYYTTKILAKVGATAVPIINKTEFETIKLPIIEKNNIEQFEKTVGKFELSIENSNSKIFASQSLQKSILNQIF